MKVDQKQGGYALLLTLVILILFSVLGLSLIILTSNGISKNEKRQSITRSTALAEMGIDRITNQIDSELTNGLGESGLGRGAFIDLLERTLDSYKCSNIKKINQDTNTGKFEVCIDDANPYTDTKDEKGESNPLRKLVNFTSIGATDNSHRVLNSRIEIGAETVPETLKYAVGTNILSKNPKNGEGNLLLHGGVEITGDIKVDGNIVTRNKGYAYLSGEKWIESLYPSTKPTIGTKTSKLVLGKNAYTLDSTEYYSTHINQTDFPTGRGNKYTQYPTNQINALFREGYAPQVVLREPVRSPIGISENKETFKYIRTTPGVTVLEVSSSKLIDSQSYPNSKVFPTYKYTERVCGKRNSNCQNVTTYTDNGSFEISGMNTFKQFSTLGDLVIKKNNTNVTFKEGLYVEGNLTIGNTNANQNTPIKDYQDITIDGPIFVNGKVTIRGANLKSNVLIYVNNDSTSAIDIQYSTMNGKTFNNKKSGSFIIFSKGNIKISNNSVDEDTPSHIKGFFYSEKDLEMFGVGSNIKIEGGISARRIVLNAIRGKASSTNFTGAQKITNSNYFEGVATQRNKDSRLQIIYDPEIISTYSDLRQQEPIIYKVDPPVERERF